MNKPVRFLFAFACALALMPLQANAAPKVIKCDNPNASVESPVHVGFAAMKKFIEEKTEGRYRVDIYDGGKLGAPNSVIQGMKMGTIQMGAESTSNLAPFAPVLGLLDAPYLFKDFKEADKVLGGTIGQKILEPLGKAGIKGVGFIPATFRWLMLQKPIHSPSEASGMKLRSTSSKVDIANLAAMGFSPSNITGPELVTALQQGTVVGLAPGAENVATEKTLAKLTPYTVATDHSYMPMVLVISQKWFKGLPEADRPIIEEAFKVATEAMSTCSRSISTPEAIRKSGMYKEVVELTPEQKQAFIDATAKVYNDFPAEWMEYVKAIRTELAK